MTVAGLPVAALPAVVLLAPAAAFALLALLPPLRRVAGALVVLSSTVAAAAALLQALALRRANVGEVVAFTVPWLRRAGEPLVEVGWRLDGLSAVMALVVAVVALSVQVYSLAYLAGEPRRALARYFAWHALFGSAMQALVLAPSTLQAFLGWELVGLCSFLLIGFWWRRPEAGRAALKAFWVTRTADGFLLMGLIVLATATGSFGWDPAGASPGVLAAGTLLVLVGVAGKSAQVPLHVWLPDAMQGPTPVSALLHAATMVAAGVFLVARTWPLFEAAPVTLAAMRWLGAVTALSAAVFALQQRELKRMLAYSTCSQLGYMVAGLGAGALGAGFFHLVTHAAFKAMLFLCAGALIHAAHSPSMDDMGGLRRRMPLTFAAWVVGGLALVGVPPFAGFFSKELVLGALAEAGAWGPLVLALLGVVFTGTYVAASIRDVFLGPEAQAGGEPAWAMRAPVAGLLLLTLVVGWPLGVPAFELASGEHWAFHLGGLSALATAAGLAGLALGWTWRRPLPAPIRPAADLLASAPLDRLYLALWRRVVLVGGRAVAWVDRYLVDGLVNLVAVATLRVADLARSLQSGRVDDLLVAVAGGAVLVVLLGWGMG